MKNCLQNYHKLTWEINLGDNVENNDNFERNKIRYLVFFIIFLMFTVTGGTYAYLAFTASDSNTIAGTTATASLDLKVERILPTNVGVMVPQIEEYLDSAISTSYSCIDGNGNTVCQVYKATVTNTSTATIQVNGTIKFSGIENIPNLKWKRITNERTIGEYTSNKASTSNVIFENNRAFQKNASDTYYFVIWIDETENEQPDNGTFRVTIEFNPANGDGLTSTITNGEGGGSQPTQLNAFATNIMAPIAEPDASIDFSQTSEASSTNGIYRRSGTENDTYPIYYYRGAVNNNLIFANFCWKVVRTTETGGLKLIYNGVPSNGQCNNTGAATAIGTQSFNVAYRQSPALSGYMYGTHYDTYEISLSDNDTYQYGNDVIYSNGKYTLTNTISSAWSDIYEIGLINNHYTCFSTETTCDRVSYIYHNSESKARYIELINGKKIEDALREMLGADDNNTDNYNTTSSLVKGDYNTEGTLDYWYLRNISQKGFDGYIEDTVWCNDRSIYSLGGFNSNGGITYEEYSEASMLLFSSVGRFLSGTVTPSLSCNRNIDKFTVSEENGNGDLWYPIGLLTADEVLLAGAASVANSEYYLNSGSHFSTLSPFSFGANSYLHIFVESDGTLSFSSPSISRYVRPSISLKSGFVLTGNGDGSVTNPYIVQ